MQVHTRKHHTSTGMVRMEKNEEEKPMDWREAFKESFGDITEAAVALRGLRNREGLTQAALGELLEVKQANISNMETGKRPIGKNLAKKLAALFRTDYRIFL